MIKDIIELLQRVDAKKIEEASAEEMCEKIDRYCDRFDFCDQCEIRALCQKTGFEFKNYPDERVNAYETITVMDYLREQLRGE